MPKVEFKVSFPESFDFGNLPEVFKWLGMLEPDSKAEFLLMMRHKTNEKFVEMIGLAAAKPHRSFLLGSFEKVMQAGMLIRLDVERQVLYNKAIPSFSMLDLFVSDFSVAPKVGHIQRLAQNDYL